ncbi:MAG: sporulation protein [Planctomycetota bacterium]
MAKCDLSIELDEPDRVYYGDEMIQGRVNVRVSDDVRCDGLVVGSGWKTHGRGNVAKMSTEEKTLYTGEWKAGQQATYPFQLPVAPWPPSYHGHYLNIDHCIDVRAKIPWAFDPKASVQFLMKSNGGPDNAKKVTNAVELKGASGAIIGIVILTVFIGVFTFMAFVNPFFLIFLGIIGPLAIGFFVFKFILPYVMLGKVEHVVESEQVTPGQPLRGEIVMTPKRSVQLNGITISLKGQEVCISGSGSNRSTHRHVFYQDTVRLAERTQLQPGVERRFAFAVPIPDKAPYSIDLDDNDIQWSGDLRVDIPRWPDWTQSLKVQVVPPTVGEEQHEPTESATDLSEQIPAGRENAAAADGPDAELTFAETAGHLWAAKGDRKQTEILVEAVTGITFPIEVFVERRLLYSGEDDSHLDPDGYAVWAHYKEPPLKLVLYVPHDLADDFEQAGRDLWKGRGMIVGYDSQHRRLQVKLVV